MPIARIEIGAEGGQIKGDLPQGMRPIDNRHDPRGAGAGADYFHGQAHGRW